MLQAFIAGNALQLVLDYLLHLVLDAVVGVKPKLRCIC